MKMTEELWEALGFELVDGLWVYTDVPGIGFVPAFFNDGSLTLLQVVLEIVKEAKKCS